MYKLDKQKADAICTAIVLGYSEGNNIRFEYDEDKDKADYEDVQKCFSLVKVVIDIGKSIAKENLPCIAAQGPAVWSGQMLKDIGGVEIELAKRIDRYIEQEKIKELYGAYIGGLSQTATIDLIGASELDLYKPQHREVERPVIESAYNKAVKVAQKIDEILKDICKKPDVRYNEIEKNYAPYGQEDKTLFKSYHGMIRAMVRFQNVPEKNSFCFEIAAGGETNKVSSCFPCATFMVASGHPPTSTHLGRGDNWNIPRTADGHESMYKKEWENKIKLWFNSGQSKLKERDPLEKLGIYELANAPELPAIFLEALTFEDSFTKRIKETFKQLQVVTR